MVVHHKRDVVNFDAVLQKGGTHTFEISGDEVPGRGPALGPGEALAPVCCAPQNSGVWFNIAARVAQKGGQCHYHPNEHGSFDVTITIPPVSHEP